MRYGRWAGVLGLRQPGDRLVLLAKVAVFGVAHHADDLIGGRRVGCGFHPEAFSDGILAVANPAGKGLIDDGDLGRGWSIVAVEITAGQEGGAKGLGVDRASPREVRLRSPPRI